MLLLRRRRQRPQASYQTNLVGYWRLDDAADASVDDYSGNARHVTNNNTVTSTTGFVGANAAQFVRANSEFYSRADEAAFEVGAQSWSACAWVYMDSNATTRRLILSKFDGNADAGSGRGWQLSVTATGTNKLKSESKDGTNSSTVEHGTSLSLSTWYFVAGGFDAAQLKSWVSLNAGAKVESAAAAAMSHNDETYQFRIGATVNPSTAWYWDGRMEQVLLYIGRVLTEADLTYFHNAGAGRILY